MYVSLIFIGGAIQSGGAGSRSSLFLWLSDSHRECSLRDVQFANRHLHQRAQEKVSPLGFYLQSFIILLGYVKSRMYSEMKCQGNFQIRTYIQECKIFYCPVMCSLKKKKELVQNLLICGAHSIQQLNIVIIWSCIRPDPNH